MTIVTRAVAKSYFETGDKPTEAQFIDLIDGAMFNEDFATLGKALVSAATTASAQNLLGIPGINIPGTVGNLILSATTTASAQTQLQIPVTAAQSDQETGTTGAKFISPSIQQYHPSASKAWGSWNGSGTIGRSSGISSITDNGVGDHTVNYSTNFSDTAYAIVYGAAVNDTAANFCQVYNTTTDKAVGSTRIYARSPTTVPAAADLTTWSMATFGDQ